MRDLRPAHKAGPGQGPGTGGGRGGAWAASVLWDPSGSLCQWPVVGLLVPRLKPGKAQSLECVAREAFRP